MESPCFVEEVSVKDSFSLRRRISVFLFLAVAPMLTAGLLFFVRDVRGDGGPPSHTDRHYLSCENGDRLNIVTWRGLRSMDD